MKPYYSHGGITIFHGDCLEILPTLDVGKIDLVLTDPPYGIDLQTDYSRFKSTGLVGRNYQQINNDAVPVDLSWLFDIGSLQVVFGANNWPQAIPFDPKSCGWIVWDKRCNEDADRLFGSPFELAVVVGRRHYGIIRMQHCGVKNADGDRSGRLHPTQKPIVLMRRLIAEFYRKGIIFDPFCGSGTTLRSAKDAGLPAIGIELEERYCEIAANRLAQEVLF